MDPIKAPDTPTSSPYDKVVLRQEATSLRELSAQQWKSGIAAWLGWLFDGLDMHLYVLVAGPFVTQLLGTGATSANVTYYSSIIQASFLVGWALGGGFFGRVGDRLGRSRALMLTILTYALFTALSFVAQTWWQLCIFRFLAALGIGGEWAVGASLLSETWPRRWRPWMAAVLQTAVNVGVLLASLAYFGMFSLPPYLGAPAGFVVPPRFVFLVGVLPAFVVLWIRRAVPEPEEWQGAKSHSRQAEPGFMELFRGKIRRISVLTTLVCALALTGHWAFNFWSVSHFRSLLQQAGFENEAINRQVGPMQMFVMVWSIAGNFFAAALARKLGYRRAIVCLCVGYFGCMLAAYGVYRAYDSMWVWLAAIALCQGVFGLFTMYLPPLFPTLLRTTGAGFCYNIGRIAAAVGTVAFGLFSTISDYRIALVAAGCLFVPAAVVAGFLPEPPDEQAVPAALE